jgi:aspartate dehydrogenase
MLKLAVVGFGAIGQEMARLLLTNPKLRITQIIVPQPMVDVTSSISAGLAPHAQVLSKIDFAADCRPDLVAECAGHEAVLAHVVPALEAGIPCIVASIGALHEADGLLRLEAASQLGNTKVKLISGAVGALDALTAARIGGLDEVCYVGRKPPRSWLGTPADQICALSELTSARVIFKGSAREAAVTYPKNANVAATIALAGLGLDRTQVELIADPGVERNVHSLVARGTFGQLEIRLENQPLLANPKTSALAVYSLTQAVCNAAEHVLF